MAIASESPAWLHTLGQIAGTILVIELSIALLIVAALSVGIALGIRWLRQNVTPVVSQNTPRIISAMTVAQQSSDKVVKGVAEFYGRRQAVQTGLRVLLFGSGAAERVREESAIKVAADLQSMSADEDSIGPEDAFTPQPGRLPARNTPTPTRPSARAVERPATREFQGANDNNHHDMTPLAGNAG